MIALRRWARHYCQPVQRLNKHPSVAEPFAYPQASPQANDDIIVAMSSGVDSSVAAALYASKYKNVRGIYMANWSQTAKCTEAEWNDVQKVCLHLKIPCERVNFEKEYWSDVFMPMIDMYERGLTPNPDLGCNKYIKFGTMVEHLARRQRERQNTWWLVTGHYSRVCHEPPRGARLLKAYDANKDQSYYLASIRASVLEKVLMPLGHYTKPQVRHMARAFGLHTAAKPDSVGLCFVSPDHTKFRHFLDEYIPPNPGNIITADGQVWGRHRGLWHATIGQKLGISMPQGDARYKGTWFVAEKRVRTNELVIVRGRDHPALFHQNVVAEQWAFFGLQHVLLMTALCMQYRSLQAPIAVESFTVDAPGTVLIRLREKQRAMAPGQNIVLYNGLEVVGSGVIGHIF